MSITSNTLLFTPQFPIPVDWTVADLQERLGNIPAERIRLNPPPGYATEDDVLRIEAMENKLYELEYGVLVEKPLGWYESILAILISTEICNYLRGNNLGQVLGADSTLKILPGVVKSPDVSFVSWSRFPKEKLARRPIPLLIPDLAIEVLSETNTSGEMAAKLARYFEAGVNMVWYVEPKTRTATVYTGLHTFEHVAPDGKINGGMVLPGFSLSLEWLFTQADRQGPE